MFEKLEWESRFTLGVNAAKNTDYKKNVSNKNCSEFNFLQKLSGCVCLSISGVKVEGSKHLALGFHQKFYLNTNSIPVAPFLEEIDLCAHRFFLYEIYSQQLLFEAFFDVIRIFGSIRPKSESTFPTVW